jgi:hypothetical protein
VSISRVREQPKGKSRGMHIYVRVDRNLGVRHVDPENYLVILHCMELLFCGLITTCITTNNTCVSPNVSCYDNSVL